MKVDLAPLAKLLGLRGLLTGLSETAAYTRDLLGEGIPDVLAIARPISASQVSEIVKWCAQNGVRIVPQGGLTGLCAGGVPTAPGNILIISLGRMNKVREIDVLGNTMTVESGAILADVKAEADEIDLYFPLTHGGEGSSQIGGNISTNSGGNNVLKYGTARDQILGLEVVLPDGEIWNGLRRLRKNTAGYDLKHLFIGAEGTLGIITAATLKLRPKPKVRETAFVAVESPLAALKFLRRLENHLGETVSAFELLSAAALDCALTIPGTRYPFQEKFGWLVLVELESATPRFDLYGAFEDALSEALETGIVLNAVIARASTHREDFWKLREAIAQSLIEEKSSLKTDTAVPVSAVPDFIENASKAVQMELPGSISIPFGHLGDGNIHFNVRKSGTMSDEDFREYWKPLSRAIEETALDLGGTISAEHGIGRLKQVDFSTFSNPVEIRLMKLIKQGLDQQGNMNPGVIFST